MIVDLEPTEDQVLVLESVSGLLADRLPVARLRDGRAYGAAAERAIWHELANLGVFGMGLPDEKGGIGYGLPEEVIVARALGLHLASPSILAQMVAAHLASSTQRAAITSGDVRAAFAAISPAGEVHRIDGEGAALVVLVGPDGAALVAADVFGPWQSHSGLDETVTLDIATVIPEHPQASPEAQHVALLLAAYQAGVAQGATDMAVDYAKTRTQFGQAIGAFQAIKHMCADMAVRAAAADAQVRYAAVTIGLGNDDREIAAARLLAAGAALENAKANVQVHGGMGFTAECDAHLFLKRAHLLGALGTSRRAEERRLIADAL
jgi:alkylation response protein AidB-like acyl-CoA dehydrogenase